VFTRSRVTILDPDAVAGNAGRLYVLSKRLVAILVWLISRYF
jgi:hypothetical protein